MDEPIIDTEYNGVLKLKIYSNRIEYETYGWPGKIKNNVILKMTIANITRKTILKGVTITTKDGTEYFMPCKDPDKLYYLVARNL